MLHCIQAKETDGATGAGKGEGEWDEEEKKCYKMREDWLRSGLRQDPCTQSLIHHSFIHSSLLDSTPGWPLHRNDKNEIFAHSQNTD
jgi:hypothetical protein